jgi:biopolymer transport protein ExbD
MKKKENVKSDVPVSAMIDVVFLLLVYFIVTSSPIVEEAFVSVNLPGPGLEGEPKMSLDVFVLEDNYQIYGKVVSLQEAELYFAAVAQIDLKMNVNVKIDPAASHGQLVLMLDRLRKVQLHNFNLHSLK